MTLNSQAVEDILAAVVLIGGIIVYSKGRIPQQTIKNLQDSNDSYIELDKARQKSIEALEGKIKEVIDNHANEKLEWTRAVADLAGQVKVYKDLPLKELAEGIKQNNIISNHILETLKSSATTLVKNTTDVATHVEEVKQDLRAA